MFIGIVARLLGLLGNRQFEAEIRRNRVRRSTNVELSRLPPEILKDLNWPPKP